MSSDARGGRLSRSRRAKVAEAGHAGDVASARAALDDADPSVRATALGALDRAGALTGADLDAAARDQSAVVRRRVATLVGRGAARVPLLELLGDDDPTVVEVAAWASGELDPPEPGAVTALGALATNHDDPLVREAAVGALGAIGDPAGLSAVLAATNDKATVRRRAAIALVAFDGPEVDAAIERLRGDRDWQVRQVAEDIG